MSPWGARGSADFRAKPQRVTPKPWIWSWDDLGPWIRRMHGAGAGGTKTTPSPGHGRDSPSP